MDSGEAIRAAIGYEERIRDLYAEAACEATDDSARALFEALGADEASHAEYLRTRLAVMDGTGSMDLPPLASALPDPRRIEASIARAGAETVGEALGGEFGALERALRAEEETSAFYRDMVGKLPEASRPLFARFLEIEEGHTRIVRAELDLVSRSGHWFDIREFDLED
ncbi:MAG: ferritin family protein [Spirochaetales bacterium]|nr:ferritin family protein [Spirochaetales bacterium]